MRSGPCMCGDPYCFSCGNPAAARWEDFICEATNRFIACIATRNSVDEGFYEFIEKNLDWIAEEYLRSRGYNLARLQQEQPDA